MTAAFLHPISPPNMTGPAGYQYWCPNCRKEHYLRTAENTPAQRDAARWEFNGDFQRPTFSPSHKYERKPMQDPDTGVWSAGRITCHHKVEGGKIIYLGDFLGRLAGQTVDMVAYEAGKPPADA